jgi:hypothetical protein
MNAFKQWYIRNQDAVTWFLIGWLTFAGLDSLAQGNYISAAISFVLAYANYALRRVRA